MSSRKKLYEYLAAKGKIKPAVMAEFMSDGGKVEEKDPKPSPSPAPPRLDEQKLKEAQESLRKAFHFWRGGRAPRVK